jgi:hypothetical protein
MVRATTDDFADGFRIAQRGLKPLLEMDGDCRLRPRSRRKAMRG